MNVVVYRTVCTLLLAVLAVAVAPAQGPAVREAVFGGRWEADNLPSSPWVLDLVQDGANTVKGRIFQHGGTSGPVDIYGGKIDGDIVTFKANAAVESTVKRIITFTGRLTGAELIFARDVEIIVSGPEPASNENGMFSATGTKQFLARKTGPAVLPLVPVAQPKDGAPPADVTGHWESMRMTFDKWFIDLKADGTTVTGTITVSPAANRRTMVDGNPRPIFDGRIEGNTLTFKVNSFDGARTIHVTGKVQGDEIAFNRLVQVNNINVQRAFGVEDIYGTSASTAWVGRRRHKPSPAEEDLQKQLAANRAKWAARTIRTYEFTVEFDCGSCWIPSSLMTFRANGTTGALVRSAARGASTGANVPEPILRFSTIDKYMDLVNEVVQMQPYSAKVAFDPTYGFITSAELRSGISIDDDIRIKISEFKVVD